MRVAVGVKERMDTHIPITVVYLLNTLARSRIGKYLGIRLNGCRISIYQSIEFSTYVLCLHKIFICAPIFPQFTMASNGVRLASHQRQWCRLITHALPRSAWNARALSTAAQNTPDIEKMLAEPSWSVQSLRMDSDAALPQPEISQTELHRLLRLSALALPSSDEEEASMMTDLKSQLRFVQAVQKVDTEGVEPLQSIRDETRQGERESMITVESLKAEFDKEVVVGRRGRIVRTKVLHQADEVHKGDLEDWDALAQASKKWGRYFVVETDKD